MTNTRIALEKLPINCMNAVERYKSLYRQYKDNGNSTLQCESRLKAKGYLEALTDAGIVTLTEQRLLFGYITL